MKTWIVFEVETIYKSGKRRTDYITALNEKRMWEIYDQHHTAAKIDDSYIVDSWIQ
jgi:hypothetical protein